MNSAKLAIICLITIVLFLIGVVIWGVNEGEKNRDRNEKEIGLRILDKERACYEWCLPGEYYYRAGSTDKAEVCNCKLSQN